MAAITPGSQVLHLYGSPSEHPPLAWSWVVEQLTTAGIYWVVGCVGGRPHPRPVWGVWHDDELYLSVGSPGLRRAARESGQLTVHLDSGTDVVVVEGQAASDGRTPPAVLAGYNAKYDWNYETDRYGELTRVRPRKVLAWRAAGPAGRDSFRTTGCWTFPG